MARVCPLFSGSTGNSYYIGSRSAGLLVDAGRSARQLEGMLKLCGIDPLAVHGILVTHEHSDHVSGLRVFAKKYGAPVFCTPGTLQALGASAAEFEVRPLPEELAIGGMEVTHFPVSHDCAQPVGYRIRTADGRVIAVATDLGFLSDQVKGALLGADLAILESNHDLDMLRFGPYPYPLKQRVLSDQGHLSNAACAGFLPQLLQSGTRRMVLGHLSRQNNTPQLALDTAQGALLQAGFVPDVDFLLEAAPVENRQGKSILL